LPERFRVELAHAPLDIGGSLELFRRSGDDLIDRWDGQQLMRAAYAGHTRWVPFVARATGSLSAPAFDVCAADTAAAASTTHLSAADPAAAASLTHLSAADPAAVASRTRVPAADPDAVGYLTRVVADTFMPAPADYAGVLDQDRVLARLDARFPGIRQIRQLDVFTALIRCISAQQVNLRWAVTTRRRLAEAFGVPHAIGGEVVYALDPERIARVDPTEIRALQFTTSKAVSIVATARAMVEGGISLEDLSGLDDEQVIERLVRIRGIGRWSADWVLARTLGRPTVVAGDLGVRKAVGLAYLGTPLPSEPQVRAATAHWGASAGVAQALLLHALGERALTPAPRG
jgi:3-methyladenine DNA glycosylase/8-oxoguanine DNA glycosylase